MKLNFNKKQFNALSKGKTIQLKHGDIGVGDFDISDAHPNLHKMLAKAYNQGKGIRLNMDHFEGSGIFGKKFDKGLKKIGIKKGVFQAARIAKPAINVALDEGTKALVKAYPAAAPAAIYAKNLTKNYIATPTKYQSKGGVKSLLKKSAVDSAADVAKFGFQMASAPDTSTGKGLIGYHARNIGKRINEVNGIGNNNSMESELGRQMKVAVQPRRINPALLAGQGVRGGSVNPFLPTRLIGTTSGGSIGNFRPAVKVYKDMRPNLRTDQPGFVAESKFIPRPYDMTFKGEGLVKHSASAVAFKKRMLKGRGINLV